MKIKEGFVLRKIGNDNVIVAVGKASVDFKNIVKINDSGALIFNELLKGNEDINEIANLLISEYDINIDIAKKDVCDFIDNLKEAKIIE